MKIRINDLARELEVKSRAVLDVLPKVGVTEKKTHSSSIEFDEAERVKKYFADRSGSDDRPRVSRAEDVRPKIDLSHISKPGDVLKAILQQKEAAAHPPAPPRPAPKAVEPPKAVPPAEVTKPPAAAAPPKTAEPAAPRAATTPPSQQPRFVTPESVAASRPVITRPPKPAVAPPVEAPTAAATETPAAAAPPTSTQEEAPAAVVESREPEKAAAPAAEVPVVSDEQVPVTTPAPDAVEPPTPTPTPAAPPAGTRPGAPVPGQPIGQRPGQPARRMIVPQTGPRPVYLAPPPPPPRPQPPVAPAGQGRPGLPVRGQPIFQRPRPGGAPGQGRPSSGPPGSRPALRPGERRMHPTRTSPTGVRPMGGASPMGVPPPGAPPRPGARPPGAPSRRPGQRGRAPYGKPEGPMKGFVPPPRLSLSTEPLPITRTITVSEGISVKDLAEKLGIRAKDLIARLLARGVFATINQTLESNLATDMARQFGADTNVITFEEQVSQETEATTPGEAEAGAQTRPPVVTIMGHVDHGKTSLLDAIRTTDVAGGEAGGITQHIGAYKVRVTDPNSPAFGREIVFLDTPGHEAFTRMRARGSKVTDIVVLVVAADDGVMPQTVEAMDHAKAANVPIIVAVNKVDKPDALPDRVKKQLADRGLMPEEWGGTTVFVDVSAKQKTNLNLLMEMICLVADLQDLKAVSDRPATGSVLEAKLDRGRGPVATVLIQNGTLKAGENFVVGNVFGKVRAMFDDRGNSLDSAPPSTPIEIIGLEGLPQAGDQFVVVTDRDKARGISEYREQKSREATLAKSSRVSLEGLAEQIKHAGMKELPIILKGDVQGSVEVLGDLLTKLSNEKVQIRILRSSVGAINEGDVLLASASNAIIIGFNVRPERKAQELAEQEKVDIRLHSIIYELQDEMKKAMTGLLEPTIREVHQGRAEVRDTFRIPKVGMVAGCYVLDGILKRDSEVRLLRDNVVVFKGKVGSLRRFKEDASEVRNGMECGIAIQNYGDIKVGDVIEAFVTEKVAAEAMA